MVKQMGLELLQINLQHSKAGSTELARRVRKKEAYVALIQEPWPHKGQVRGLGKKGLYAPECGRGQAPRACILASPGISIWPLPALSHRDCMAVEATLGARKVLLASLYMPGDKAVPEACIRRLVDHAASTGHGLLIGCDANAHHSYWGSTDTNDRGEQLLEVVMGTGL